MSSPVSVIEYFSITGYSPRVPRISAKARRAQLLAAGAELWASRSFDAISSYQIVRRTGVSIGLVYHHFGSKRGYYIAVVTEIARQLLDLVVLPQKVPFDQALETALGAFLTHLDEHESLYRATLRGGLGFDPQVDRIAESTRWTLVDRFLDRRGWSGDRHRRRIVYGWLGFVEQIALDWASNRDCPPETIVGLGADAFRRLTA